MESNRKNSSKEKDDFLCPEKALFAEKRDQETSTAITSLFITLKNIEVSPERIAKNQWKSMGRNGKIEFYY